MPIDVVHPMAVPPEPIPEPLIPPAPYTYVNHAPLPEPVPYADYASYYPNQAFDPTQIQPWLQAIEPPLLVPQGYPHGYATSPGPHFEPFHPMQELADCHTPPLPQLFYPEAIPPPTILPYSASYQIPTAEPLQPDLMHVIPPVTMTTKMTGQIPIPVPKPSSPAPDAVVYSPRPQLTPKHSFTRDPVLGSISKSERVEELEKMADEVAKRNRDLSGDLPKAGESDKKMNGNVHKTLPGPPDDVINPNQQRRRDLMSVFPVDHQVQEHAPALGGMTYQTPPTPTLMAVLGPPKQTLPPPASTTRTGRSPPNLLTSESGLDALERRLLAEVGTRKHLEHQNIITEEDEDQENGRRRHEIRTKGFKDHQLGRRDVRDVLLPSSSVGRVSGVANGNHRLPPIDTDLDLDLVGKEEGADSGGVDGGGSRRDENGATAPIAIPMKSPDPLNESAISSLTLGGEGLVSGLPDTGFGFSNGAAAAVNDSDGEGDGEADFDGRTHRAGSASLSGGSNNGSDRMVLDARGDGGGFHKHMRQRAEVSTPTIMVPPERNKARSRRSGGGVEAKEKVKTSSSKKKERLNGTGNSTSGPKKSRNKSTAAAKGRVAAWLGGIDPAIPPQEEIIPPSPSVIRDLDSLSFEDEQRASVRLLGRSPLAAAAPLLPLHPDSTSPTTPGGPIVSNTRTDDVVATNEGDNDKVVSAAPNPRSSGFVSIATLKRDTITLPPTNSVVRRPLLLSRDATVIEEARRVQDLWSSTLPDSTLDKDTLLKPGGAAGDTMSFNRKPAPSKPVGTTPLSYSAAVTSTPPSVPTSSSSGAPRNLWKIADQTQQLSSTSTSTSQPKGRQVPPSTTKPPGYRPPNKKLPMFPPPINPEVKYDIRSARGGRGGKVTSVASLWASGAINNQHRNHQTTTTTAAAAAASHNIVKDKVKEVPKRLFTTAEEVPHSLSSLTSSKPVKPEKKLFSAAVMTPAPALKHVRAYTPAVVASGSGSGPKKMSSTPALSVGVLGGKPAASRSTDNVVAVHHKPPGPTTNFFQGGKTTPTALSTPSSSTGPPLAKLHELTTAKRGIGGGTKGMGKPAVVNGPPGVMNKASSDPAVISSSHAIPTLSSTASLVIPHDQNSTGQRHHRHPLPPRVAVVKKLPISTIAGAGGVGSSGGSGSRSGSSVSPRPGSPPQAAVVENEDNNNNNNNDNTNSNHQQPSKPAELAFGQARLRDLIKKYQGSSPAGVGQKM